MIIHHYFKHVCCSLDHTLNNFSEILFECKTEISKFSKFSFKQESNSVGCVLPGCQLYVLRWSPDLSTTIHGVGMGRGAQVNKFQQVSSDGHHMLAAIGPGLYNVQSDVQGGSYVCTVMSKASWVMVTWGPQWCARFREICTFF